MHEHNPRIEKKNMEMNFDEMNCEGVKYHNFVSKTINMHIYIQVVKKTIDFLSELKGE